MTRDKLFELSHLRDCYLSYEEGSDIHGRDVKDRIARINSSLKGRGLITCFYESFSNDEMVKQVCNGMDKSRSVVCFLTREYINKAMGDKPTEHCNQEFNYTLRRKHPSHLIPVALEQGLSNLASLPGNLAMAFDGKQCIDLSQDEGFDAKVEELYRAIIAISKTTKQFSTVSDNSMLAKFDKPKEEQQFYQWLARSTNIEESRRIIYCTALVRNGVSSVFVLAEMMKKNANFLLSLGFTGPDADAVALAVRDLGLGYQPVTDFNQDQTIEGIVFALRKASKFPEEPELTQSALLAVAKIATSNKLMPNILTEAGICEAVLKLMPRTLGHAKSMEHGCQSLHCIARGHPDIIHKLGAMSACDVLPRTLRSHMKSPGVIFHGCEAIAVLATDKDNRVLFSNSGCCEVLVQVLQKCSDDPQVVEKSCLACNWVTKKNETNIGKFGVSGACEALAVVLEKHGEHLAVVEQVFDLVGQLSVDPSNRKLFGHMQFCVSFVKALHCQMENPLAVQHGCSALAAFVLGSAFNRTQLGQAGACQAVRKALEKYHENAAVAEAACQGIFGLSSGTYDHRQIFKGLQPLLQGIINNPAMPENTRKEAREALATV